MNMCGRCACCAFLVSCGSLPAYHWPTNAPTHACTHAHALRPGSSAAKLAMEEEESREKASGEAFQSWAAEKEKVMRGKKEKAKADEDRKRRKEEEKKVKSGKAYRRWMKGANRGKYYSFSGEVGQKVSVLVEPKERSAEI